MANRPRQKMKPALVTFLIATLLGTTACGTQKEPGTADPGTKPAPKPEPVELTMFYPWSGYPKEKFMEDAGNSIIKKYPHISINYVQNEKGSSYEALIAGGLKPDLIMTTDSSFAAVKTVGWDGDITELAAKNKYNFDAINPGVLKGIQAVDPGKIAGLPSHVNSLALFYNKDLFDKFGVPYLTDGMTWDQVYEVAKKITRLEGGTVYRGFGIRTGNFIGMNQLSLPVVDKNNKAVFNTDSWKNYIGNFARFYQVPGYGATKELVEGAKAYDMFLKDQTLAMLVQMQSDYPRESLGQKINWDVVSYPTLAANPGTGPQPNIVFYVIPKTSDKRDSAFQALTAILEGEQQKAFVKTGLGSVLKQSPAASIGADVVPDLKGKNAKSLFPVKYADLVEPNTYLGVAQGQVYQAFLAAVLGSDDLNTALRVAQENANKAIETQLANKK
ncbi:ABC transporter substrate-binding protein [Paenibacillus ginsengarvi]|uniref:Carbohydrate ABC transporter substrate-binding protein n=1 Tax=Paenibacillus ginsengarvi TaxID=400777 RepID=A0A3B0CKG1_9BACL|nr:ABC transporter substrate-binding protein [Paenibacillus ginsengarvi]RKN84486.1 carbohydrate ABC transporter substrate-binding protein [Paenibacillus ginsengarvi]